jgi:RNA polymerase sigma factor (sigma-70 family)
VYGVCQRVLHNAHDAEDAFQATFLVLARKAHSILRRGALGSWLYGVAFRVALKARAAAVRRRKHERRAARPEGRSGPDGPWDEVRPILDEEVNRLPDKYRRPVVLCYFEGKTYQEAALLLGWPAGTASVRLARARELLRNRLALRGLALSPCALAACLAEVSASAAELGRLADAAAGAAVRWLVDPAAAGVSAQVIALTEGVVKAMSLRKWKTLAGVIVAAGLTLGGAGALWRPAAPAPAAAADRPVVTPESADQRGPAEDARPPVIPAADPPPEAESPTAVSPRRLAPPGDPARPTRTRIALINMTRALKGSKKYQALQADLRDRTQKAREKLEALHRKYQKYQAVHDPATPANRREEYARRLKQLQREIEDEQTSVKALMSRMSGDMLRTMYREIEDAARRVATARDIDLVLFCTDAVTDADFYNPTNLERKLSQPGALMPLVVAPGMDITDTVIEALNQAYRSSGGSRP